MASRARHRLRAFTRAALGSLGRRASAPPEHPQTILVLQELLLGDTLMLAPLLARLRARYPEAEIFVIARPEFLPLFSGAPYGVRALPFSETDPNAIEALAPARGCDLALVPGENRYAAVARALGARWVVALADARARKNRFVDASVALPDTPVDLGELFASLAGPGAGETYRPGDWPAPAAAPFDALAAPYALLHVGARTPLRHWPAARWAQLSEALDAEGLTVVLSAGPQEAALIAAIDPTGRIRSYPGTLDLAQLWALVERAALLVSLDTGVAHIAKLTGTPSLCLYGPGSALLFGRGRFFADAPFTEITVEDFHCRDQRLLFKREIPWVRRCARTLAECARPACMEAISFETVRAAARAALAQAPAASSRSTRA